MAVDDEELAREILEVLAGASRGKAVHGQPARPHYLTAYQILRRLPLHVRQALINEYGEPGKHAGRQFTAVSRLAQVAREVAEYDYMDAKDLAFEFDDEHRPVAGGNRVVGLYRLRRE